MELEEQEICSCLRAAGCDRQKADTIAACWKNGDERGCMAQLNAYRSEALSEVHKAESQIDRIDYLMYQMEKDAADRRKK